MKHAREKSEAKYDILLKAKELAGYTLRITSNEKHFPKRYRLTVTNKMQEMSMNIVEWLVMANEIYPETKQDLEERVILQKKARAECRAMLTMMEIAAVTFSIRPETLREWTDKTTKLKNQVTRWILADKERFKKV